MSTNEQDFAERIMSGNMDLSELKDMSSGELVSAVTVSDWGACYSSSTDQLSAFCTVTAANSGDNITGVGLIAYNSSGTTMLCLQYTNNFSSPSVQTSVGTNLYTSSMGGQILCIVYGWTEQSGMFYISDTLSVGSC